MAPKFVQKYYQKDGINGDPPTIQWRHLWADALKVVITFLLTALLGASCSVIKTWGEIKTDVTNLKKEMVEVKENHKALFNSTSDLARQFSRMDGKLDILISRSQ